MKVLNYVYLAPFFLHRYCSSKHLHSQHLRMCIILPNKKNAQVVEQIIVTVKTVAFLSALL